MLFLLDANNLIHTYYHIRTNEDRYDVTERVLQRMERLRHHFQTCYPDCSFVACFDNGKPTFRHMLYADYKANRTKDQDLIEVIANVFEATNSDADWIGLRAPLLLEADDLIASLAAHYQGRVIIHSSDKDMRQCLVDGRVTILRKSNVDEDKRALAFEFYSAKALRDEFGFEPAQWVDYQAIAGDSSDNLQSLSWRWAGQELAKMIVQSGADLATLSLADERLNKRQSHTLHEFQTNLKLIRQLIALRNDIDWPYELAHLQELELVQ